MKCAPKFSPVDSDLSRWSYSFSKGYPKGGTRKNGKCVHISPHRIVLSRKLGRSLSRWEYCDHINFDLLDCTRENLRLVSPSGSAQHRRHGKNRGTTLHRKSGKWQAAVNTTKKYYYLGLFTKRSNAAMAAKLKRDELGFLQ